MSKNLDTTIIIKTFLRPHKLLRLLESIAVFYPDIPIIIIDDSEEPIEREWQKNIQYHHTEYDIGLSEGRNRGVAMAKTRYALITDDDMEFVADTKIEIFLDILQNQDYDLVAGRFYDGYLRKIFPFDGLFEMKGDILHVNVNHVQNKFKPRKVDFVQNFFLAETKFLLDNKWDSELKTVDHEDFFWRLKQKNAKIAHTDRVTVQHVLSRLLKQEDAEYHQKRHIREKYFYDLACQKIGVARFLLNQQMGFFKKLCSQCYYLCSQCYYIFILLPIAYLEKRQANHFIYRLLLRFYKKLRVILLSVWRFALYIPKRLLRLTF